MAKFKKGESGNPNGRPSGARNRTTEQIRSVLKEIYEDGLDNLRDKLNELEPKDYVSAINQIARHVLPPPVVDLSQFSESDLDLLIERLKKKQHE